MKGYFINPKDKTIKEIVMFTKDVDLQSLINTVHLILGVDKIDGMLYNSYSFLFYQEQHDSHKKDYKHWFEIEGNIKPKIMTNKQVSKEIIISSIFLIIMFSLFTITLSL